MTRGAKDPDPDAFSYIKAAVKDSYDRLIAPAIEREIRNQLTEDAEDGAIRVFASNLEQLLMQQPIAGKVVLGWDPAFRTGCKLAVADPTGRILDTKVIYPTAPQNKVREAKQELQKLVDKYNVSVISVGNGTASRESEQVIIEFIKEQKKPLQYVIVNCQKTSGSSGGTGQDRSQSDRSRPVSARHEPEKAGQRPHRRRGKVCQQSRRGP